jgi:hypothetical protein
MPSARICDTTLQMNKGFKCIRVFTSNTCFANGFCIRTWGNEFIGIN